MADVYSMRRMRRPELDLIMEWAAAEGWNPGTHDADAFASADPDGFFVGTIGDEIVASVSVVTYDASYAFLGLYVVRPEFRGKGYGLRLWRHALERTSARTVGLDGVVAQIPTYERAGFSLAYHSVRFVTRALARPVEEAGVRAISDADLPRVIEYDRRVFGVGRPRFIGPWLARAGVHARLAEESGEILGYGAIRPATEGYRIGPLFAASRPVADNLLTELLGSVPPGVDVAVDVPELNPEALSLVRARRMIPQFQTARMYRGDPPRMPVQHIYGVTSFELG
jgi:GNAT superfamily N-acetyltransferase